MNIIWTLRIALARLLLGQPQGHEYYFRGRRLFVRLAKGSAEAVAVEVTNRPQYAR